MPIINFLHLLRQGHTEQAQQALQEFLAQSISPEEQGEALIALASVHMEIENTANKEYIKLLNYAISELKVLQKNNTALEDGLNLAKVRKQLES